MKRNNKIKKKAKKKIGFCEREYGKIRMESSRHYDFVDELNTGSIGFKLLTAYSMHSHDDKEIEEYQ